MEGVRVSWTITAGGGSLSANTSTTDAGGRASVTWTLGTAAGVQSVTANVPSVGNVIFEATAAPESPARIQLDRDSLHFEVLGDTSRVGAVVTDRFGNAFPSSSLTWSSSDTTVASVDAAGLVRGLAIGEAQITVAADTLRRIVRVVVAPRIVRFSVTPKVGILSSIGDTLRLGAWGFDRHGRAVAGLTHTWTSLTPNIATVTEAGLVRAVANGRARILVRQVDTGLADTADIEVQQVLRRIVVSPSSRTFVSLGETQTFTAALLDGNDVPVDATAEWSTSDSTVATVTAAGVVQARKNGQVRITAASGSISGAAEITVAQVAARVRVAPENVALASLGQTQVLSAVAEDAAGNVLPGISITWSSADAAVASVDPASGTVTAVSNGTAVLTAHAGDATDAPRGVATVVVSQVPTAIAMHAGDGGPGVVGSTRMIEARVTDARGAGVAGVSVSWAVLSGGGSVNAAVSTSGANGIASINWTLGSTPGAQSATATAPGISGSPITYSATATPAPASELVLTTQPAATAQSGTALTTQPVVQLRDAFGNPVAQSGVTVTVAIATGGGTLGGTTTADTDSNGQAAFTDLVLSGTAGDRTLSFSAAGLTGATSHAIDLMAGAASQLSVETQPSSTAQSGIAFPQQPVLQLRDAAGNPVSQAGVSVTAVIASGGGSLGGTVTVDTDASGVATFTNLSITGSAGDRTLGFSATGLTSATSGTISVLAGAPAQLAIVTQPSSTAEAGTAFAQQPELQLQDASGNPAAEAGVTITATIASGGGMLGGTVTADSDASGVVSFTNLSIGGTAGSRTLSFSASGLTGATSGTINVTAGTAAALAFSVQPSNVVASAPVAPAVQVSIVDAFGNLVTGSTDNVTVAIGTNPSGGTLSSTTTVAAVGGMATFSNLSINLVGTGYTLTAASGSLTGATSAGFNVTHGPLDHFLVEASGGGAIGEQQAGTPFNVRVTARDAYNNTVTSFTGTVGFTSTPSGGISAGATSGTFAAGVLSSHGITFGTPGNFTLTATRTSGSESGTSNSFNVQAPPTAVNDGPAPNSSPGDPYHAFYSTSGSPQTFVLSAPGVLSNDNVGFPTATITSFGADSLGGSVTTYAAGSSVSPLPGDGRTTGSLSVGANGTITFTPPDNFTGNYVFRYRLTNAGGTSDAQVTIAVGARPVATSDTYSPTLVGNVPINTAISTQFRVTANDQGDGKTFAITGQTGGTATLNPDSTFTFRPAPGFEGTASFTYTITNGFGTSSAATVSMTVGSPIWFVNAGAGSGGDGRYDAPFNSLASFAAINNGTGSNPAANDRIFLYTGSYTGGLTLLGGQRLIGQGATASLSSIAGLTWPADAGPEPAMSGTAPTLTGSGITAVTLGSNNTLRGFNLGNVGSTGTALGGSSFGTLAISEVGINTDGRALSLASGTLAGGFPQLTSTGGANNILLSQIGTSGTVMLGAAGNALSGASGDAVSITGGTGSFTLPATVSNTAAAYAINVSDKAAGVVNFDGAISSSGSGRGVRLASNTGATMHFDGGLNLSTGSSDAFTATGGGTVVATQNNTTIVNTLTTTTGVALNVQNTTIGSGGLVFRSISANGGANGIALSNTGSTAGLTVTGSGTPGSGGTIQNTTGAGISLASTTSPSFNNMSVQSTAWSGVNGTGVNNFSFTNGTINNSGTAGTDLADSNIDFYVGSSITTEQSLTGVVTITGNTLTNALGHGIDIGNGSGTISDLNISNNTITSSTSATLSKGSGMRIVVDGSGGTVAHLTRATIANNVISNFPSDGGIILSCGNGNTSGAAGTCGTVGSATNKVSITGNRIAGDPGSKMATKAIAAATSGYGQTNLDISNNGTVGEPLRNTVGHMIDVNAMGQAQVVATISGNHIQANNVFSSRGIAVGADSATSFPTTTVLTATISNNTISATDGPGISATAVRSGTTVKASITSNNVSAPTGGNYGIFVATNPNNTVTPTMCLNITGNTTAGGTASGTTWPGIGLTKRTASTFGIVGLSPTPAGTPTVENYVNAQNTSASGAFGTGGTALGSATSGFTSCTFP